MRGRGHGSIARAVVLTAILLADAPVGASSIADRLGGAPLTRTIARALASAAVRAAPVNAASPGLIYEWSDAMMTWDPSLFGQTLLERPETIGRGNFAIDTSYRWVQLQTLDGQDLGRLSDTSPPICGRSACRPGPFTLDAYHVDAATHEIDVGGTVGVLRDVEISVTVPVLLDDFHNRITMRDLGPSPGTGAVLFDGAGENAPVGVGDVLLRSKYLLPRLTRWASLAVGLQLRLPTGNEDELQGTGTVGISPLLYAAMPRVPVWGDVVVRPYLNVGADIDADDPSDTETRWGVGLDVQPAQRLVLALGFLGRHQFQPFGPPGSLDVTRCLGSRAACLRPDPPSGIEPLFHVAGGGRDLYDASIGVRFATLGRRLLFSASAVVPLNDEGLRAGPIPVVAVELPFVTPSSGEEDAP